MRVAVRYYSRSGNTKLIAEAIAEAAGVEAISADSPEAAITEPVDVLFVGGALYAYGIDAKLKAFLDTVPGDKVGKAAVFSTSWISKHAIELIEQGLADQGIEVPGEAFYVRGKPSAAKLRDAKAFAQKNL